MSRSSKVLYVGNLPGDVREREVEDIFYKYGPIAHVDLKIPPRPPGYAFVEFEEARDAADAMRGRDGYDFDGHRLRVELAHGGRGNGNLSSSDRHSNHGGGRGGGGRGGGVSRRSDYRVMVSGLPSSASWQDLKDHMRRAGDVCFAQVFREGGGTTGIVDYTNYDDMKYAIRKLDDSEFKNAFSRGVIRVPPEAEVTVAAAVVVEVRVGAGVRANLQNLNLHAVQDLVQDLYLLALGRALDRSRVLCQDHGQGPGLQHHLNVLVKAPKRARVQVHVQVVAVAIVGPGDLETLWVRLRCIAD